MLITHRDIIGFVEIDSPPSRRQARIRTVSEPRAVTEHAVGTRNVNAERVIANYKEVYERTGDPAALPTDHEPGSEEKTLVLNARAALKLITLHHPHDSVECRSKSLPVMLNGFYEPPEYDDDSFFDEEDDE